MEPSPDLCLSAQTNADRVVQAGVLPVQVLYSGKIEAATENQLQRLCSELLAITDLADTRVKVHVLSYRGAWPALAMHGCTLRPACLQWRSRLT